MPRKAREKYDEAVYHVMCRSISELMLFREDKDKDYYLGLLKRYIDKFKCSIYGYCLMDNHLHLHLDPKGFDISKFMHCSNTAYVRYYNKKYMRHGHLFQDRFESRVLDTDEYNLTVSAYIHNNAHDINGFSGKEEYYKHSSYGIYLGISKDSYRVLDRSFIRKLFNITNERNFRERYFGFVSQVRNVSGYNNLRKTLSTAVENEYLSGRNIIIRDLAPDKLISIISERLQADQIVGLAAKGKRNFLNFRAFIAYTLRILSGASYKEICSILYNITISGCARLCDKGYGLLNSKDLRYASLFNELVGCNT